MADDMGFSDLGCYGGEIPTPHLDQLAYGGLRFTQFYNTGRCCPTRASLLSGLYPHQAGVGHMMADRGHDGYRGELNRRCVTLAEALKPTGYAAYMTGKWHVTQGTQPDGPKDNWPLQRGFDRFYGTITGAGSFFDPGTLTRDNTMISPFADPEYQPEQFYYTDAISDHAVTFIEEHQSNASATPFFLYVAYTCAHWPMHALQDDIELFEGRYSQGYRATREARFERLLQSGMIDSKWKLSKQRGDWEQVEAKQWEQRCMEVYAAMIHAMDRGIGRIVATLRRQQKLDNTLILYCQDNGGCQEGVGRKGDFKRPVAATLAPIASDALRTDVIPKQNRAGVPTLTGPGIMPGPEDTYIAYGLAWANVSNTPFREFKHFVHEGGIASPLIVHWPRGLRQPGRLVHDPAHLIDIMATCVDVAHAEYPRQYNDRAIQPMEGVTLSPAFEGQAIQRAAPLFWEHEGNRAIRQGRWKLVAKENRPWELYDMQSDRTETRDLTDEHPEIVANLEDQWTRWARRANVLPLGTWRADPEQGEVNRQQLLFPLGSSDVLPRHQAPYVVGRDLRIDVQITNRNGGGVLVAQGGSSQGYALWINNEGRLCLSVRCNGRLSTVTDRQTAPVGQFSATARISKSGGLQLTVGDRTMRGQAQSLSMPVDGLEVGQDLKGAVGDYATPNSFAGSIQSVQIRLSQ